MKRIVDLAMALGEQERGTRHADGLRCESVATHTVMLMLALYEVKSLGLLHFDLDHALRLALVHDLPEALVGDTNTLGISDEARRTKDEREAAAISLLLDRSVPGALSPDLRWDLETYHVAPNPPLEVEVVGYLDKILPKFTHLRNNCAMLVEGGWTAETLASELGKQRVKLQEKYPRVAASFEPIYDAAVREVLDKMAARGGEG